MKRIYATDGSGKSAPTWLIYPALLMATPFILAGCFIRGIAAGFRTGYLECRVELESLARLWRSAR